MRIAILTCGGDCPGLNAVLRGVTKAAEKLGWQVIGFLDGFEGLLPPAQYIVLDHTRTHGIMQQGGTILGTTSRAISLPKWARVKWRKFRPKSLRKRDGPWRTWRSTALSWSVEMAL